MHVDIGFLSLIVGVSWLHVTGIFSTGHARPDALSSVPSVVPMGNRSSLLAFRKKQKQGSAAKLPDTASSAAQLVPPLASARLPEQPQLSSREDSARDDALTPRPAHASGLDPDADPLEFFREAQSFAESGSSDHASLQYSQALCLQTKQEYAAAR